MTMTLQERRPGPLLTIQETADLLRLSRAKVYALAQRGELPTVKVGRSVRVRGDRLEAWMDDHSR